MSQQDAQPLRVPAVGDVESHVFTDVSRGDGLERGRLVAQHAEVRRRHTTARRRVPWFLLIEAYELARLRVRQRREQNRMGDVEHRGRSADSHGKGGDHDRRETRTAPGLADRVPEVLLDRAPMLLRRLKEQVTQHLEPQPERPLGHAGAEQQRHLMAVLVAELPRI